MVIDAKAGRQTTREWSAADLINSLQWLKRMNARGADILFRPLGGSELRLVESLDAAGIDRLRNRGLSPAVIIETSAGRFEAWVKLSGRPLPVTEREELLSKLSRTVAGVEKHGRLAGFTNQQLEPSTAGRKPFALVREATGEVAPLTEQYFAEIKRRIEDKAAEQQRLTEAARARPGGRGRSR